MIRVLLVEDSPVAMAVLKRLLEPLSDIEVAGSASNGREALEMVPRLKPDVICTDLHMPHMDGLTFIREVMSRHPTPILVISVSVREGDQGNIFQLLEAGAVDVFPKPRGGLDRKNHLVGEGLARKIRVLSGVSPVRRRRSGAPIAASPSSSSTISRFQSGAPAELTGELVAIGASTGGPQSLKRLLEQLPVGFPAALVCIQHLGEGFLAQLVEWLDKSTVLPVQIAVFGERPRPGVIYFPPEGRHLILDAQGFFQGRRPEQIDDFCPSVSIFFHSAAEVKGRRMVGVLLTGIGKDGADGLLAIKQRGGVTIAQDESSSVVWGMPKQAIDMGAARHVLSLDLIGKALAGLKSA